MGNGPETDLQDLPKTSNELEVVLRGHIKLDILGLSDKKNIQ